MTKHPGHSGGTAPDSHRIPLPSPSRIMSHPLAATGTRELTLASGWRSPGLRLGLVPRATHQHRSRWSTVADGDPHRRFAVKGRASHERRSIDEHPPDDLTAGFVIIAAKRLRTAPLDVLGHPAFPEG